MRYIVDGYNYLFRIMVAGQELQLQRDAVIYDLNFKASAFNLDLTIVFDAHYQEGDCSVTHYQDIEIIYTAEHVSADDHIIKSLKHVDNPKLYILVTSDNKLAWQARCQLIKTQSVEDFMLFLDKRSKNQERRKEEAKETLYDSPKPLLEKLQKPKIIKGLSLTPTPEHNIDYYEKAFTDKLKKSSDSPPEISFNKSKKLSKEALAFTREKEEQEKQIVPEIKNYDNESDEDRWLRIFEQGS